MNSIKNQIYQEYKVLFDSINWDKCRIVGLFALYCFKNKIPNNVNPIQIVMNIQDKNEYEKELHSFLRNTGARTISENVCEIIGIGKIEFIIETQNEPWYIKLKKFIMAPTFKYSCLKNLQLFYNQTSKTFHYEYDLELIENLNNNTILVEEQPDTELLEKFKELEINTITRPDFNTFLYTC